MRRYSKYKFTFSVLHPSTKKCSGCAYLINKSCDLKKIKLFLPRGRRGKIKWCIISNSWVGKNNIACVSWRSKIRKKKKKP